MSTIKIEKLVTDENVSLSVHNDSIFIHIKGLDKLAIVNYNEELFEIIKNARFRVPTTPETIKNYKYIYSNEYNKFLHQIVFDYYFGEDFRKKMYKLYYIIEHLDNNGFNCDISNLFALKKVKNTYKGWNFDKESKEALPIIALKIYHIIANKTFQISIAVNQTFWNESSGKALSSIKLLYDYNYEIVLQDAEQILESIIETHKINFGKWRELYRFKDIKTTYFEDIKLTEDEMKQGYGSFVIRNGKHYLLIGQSGESFGFINSIPYEKDWDLNK
ncbi:hypothetical protein [Clostridium estertheticum]|uniref:hypothetical protein n=1 Tax=Clostridium estertheticum TaxID=238834 RepID=UPI001C7CA674|nr:hypothetical protein [Clostridium estertheticum]MBX4267175.1 hypothetical protein [Clostridium estertheticum]WLC91298.1 hypothetical protein KTC95_24140 [Clostridium estertheticum]